MTRTAPFSKAAIRNACFAGFFAVAPVGLFGIAAIGNGINQRNIAACNDGTWAACEKLVNIDGTHREVTNPKFKALLAKREAAEREANKWQPTQTNVLILANACANEKLKPNLKDPSSLRVLNQGMSDLTDKTVTVWVDYNAINGFGGRTRNTFSCTYTR